MIPFLLETLAATVAIVIFWQFFRPSGAPRSRLATAFFIILGLVVLSAAALLAFVLYGMRWG